MFDAKQEILKFWFKDTEPKQWFQVNNDFDQLIRKKFNQVYKLAERNIFDDWQDNDKGCLALCILYDQFPRNMFRNTPKAFEKDYEARKIARKAICNNFDQSLTSIEKTFLYLPFEHSENIEDQEHSMELFTKLKDKEPLAYEYALRHYEVIKEFGRFPHRNLILGRENTKKEEDYLSSPNAGF